MQQCLKEMIQKSPSQAGPLPVQCLSWSPEDRQKAPWLLCLVCELFWVSEEEEMEQSEWHGFDWSLVGIRGLLFS